MKQLSWPHIFFLFILLLNMIWWSVITIISAWRPEGITRGDASIVAAIYFVGLALYANQHPAA